MNGIIIEAPEAITIGGETFSPQAPPPGFRHDPNLGLVIHERMTARRIHAQPPPDDWTGEARATITPDGDYLLLFTAGRGHYGGRFGERFAKVNDMLAFRSSDRGASWSGPTRAWDVPYNQHGFIPFIPRGSRRIYAFGTEPLPAEFTDRENAPIAFRTSDDDGRTWLPPTFIRPLNDPDFRGMSLMRMTETADGAWLLGSHTAIGTADPTFWTHDTIATRQYLLRSEDCGASWTLLPAARPDGWFAPGFNRMDEGRPLALGDGTALLLIRTPAGHLWTTRSDDGGRTWAEPGPTPLVHPDAPPMLFALAGGQTLVAFHHNRATGRNFNHADRGELWVSASTDGGVSWSAPRFVLANAASQPADRGPLHHSNVSYADLLVDGDDLHLFFPHQFRQILQVSFRRDDLDLLPTREELRS